MSPHEADRFETELARLTARETAHGRLVFELAQLDEAGMASCCRVHLLRDGRDAGATTAVEVRGLDSLGDVRWEPAKDPAVVLGQLVRHLVACLPTRIGRKAVELVPYVEVRYVDRVEGGLGHEPASILGPALRQAAQFVAGRVLPPASIRDVGDRRAKARSKARRKKGRRKQP